MVLVDHGIAQRIGFQVELDDGLPDRRALLEAASAAVAQQRVDEMCRKLLANTILEDYTIEAIEAERLAPR